MQKENVQIDLMGPTVVTLTGFLTLPEEAKAVVLLIHANSKNDPDELDNHITQLLNKRNIATLVIGLLTAKEDIVERNSLNTILLGDRLVQVTNWIKEQGSLQSLSIGYSGIDKGAASSLQAAALLNGHIGSVVCIGGHPELARHALGKINAPVQLITGELDSQSIYMNQIALDQIRSTKKLVIIENASGSFSELGAFEKAARSAVDWLEEHLLWKQNSPLYT